MNRRGFFQTLTALAIAPTAMVAPIPTLTELLPQQPPKPKLTLDEIGSKYAQALARSMRETRETLTANILNRSFEQAPLSDRISQKHAAAYADWRGVFGSVGA